MKKCPFCGASIDDSARFCLHCMTSLTEKEQILLHQKKKPQWIIPILVAIVVSFVAVLLLFGQKTAPNKAPSDDPSQNFTLEERHTEPSELPTADELHTHDFSEQNTASKYLKTKATCTSPALYYYSCACGEKGSEAFPHGEAADHTAVTDAGKPADCTKAGLTDGLHCDLCGTVLRAQASIPIVNHSFDNDRDESCNVCGFVRVLNCKHEKTVKLSAVAPTCTKGGLTEGKRCTLCEEILTAQAVLSPAGHTEIIDQAIAATCTADGKTEGKHCAVCQIVFIPQQKLARTGHSFDPRDPLAPCALCGAQPPHIHSYSLQNTASNYLKTEANCTSPALYYYSCACGEKGSEAFPYGTTGDHTLVTEKGYPAGCAKAGLSDKTYCSACQIVFSPHSEIAALGHTYRLGNSSACKTCGEKGAVTVEKKQEFPLVLSATYQINSCTYVIRPTYGEMLKITFQVNFTNVSSEPTNTCPSASLFLPKAGYAHGDCTYYPSRVNPNESGSFGFEFVVPNNEPSLVLTFR